MNLPKLKKSNRRREYDLYSDKIRDAVVYNYLFGALTHRELDEKIMKLDETITGYQSMNILHFLGLTVEFKGIFSGYSIETAISELKSSSSDNYIEIINCLTRYFNINQEDFDAKEDHNLINRVNEILDKNEEGTPFKHKGIKKPKDNPVIVNGKKVFSRDRNTALNALSYANYACEVDQSHPTFIRKSTDCAYTEPHHLIPLAFSDDFDASLDVEENIVSLCSNCHNHLHYGRDIDEMLSSLYEQRKELLEKIDIKITYDQLKTYYK